MLPAILFLEIYPYKQSCIAHKISGIYVFPYGLVLRGPSKTNIKCAGESDNNCKSFGLFL
jgi:hypothetical protein